MSDEHVKELLSGYIDEVLSPGERGRVDAHLPGCRECRDELDELRRVSKMVAGLPKRELPPGFLTRLKSRRRSAESKGAPLAWLPLSPKVAACAAAVLVAMVVCMREIRYRLAPSILPEEPAAQTAAPLTEEQELDRELSRRRKALDAEKSWRGVMDGAQSAPADKALSLAPQTASVGSMAAERSFAQSRGAAARGAESLSAGGAGGSPARAMKDELARDGDAFQASFESGKTYLAQAEPTSAAGSGKAPAVPGGPYAPATAGSGKAPAAPARAKLKSDGAPVGEVPGKQGPAMATNESIYAFLQKEKSRMGIREIITPSSQPEGRPPETPPPPTQLDARQAAALGMTAAAAAGQGSSDEGAGAGDGLPDRPMSRQEAMAAMKTMASGLSRMNEDYRWKKNPSVPLESTGQSKPRLLATAQASRPIIPEPAAAPAPADRPAKADSLVAPLGSDAKGVASDTVSGMVRKPSSHKKALKVKRSWSSAQGGMGGGGGAVIRKNEDWADMWGRMHFAPQLPSVDFSKEMAVAVFGERSEEQSRSIEIVSVSEEDGRLLVRFRTKVDESASAPKPSAPYHVVVVPASDLPFDFVQVP